MLREISWEPPNGNSGEHRACAANYSAHRRPGSIFFAGQHCRGRASRCRASAIPMPALWLLRSLPEHTDPNAHQRETVHFIAGAGEDWDAFVAFCVSRNFAGIECLSGIPGSVGATPVQNVGAYGQEVSQTIISALVFDLVSKEVREMDGAECEFGYRSSVFNTRERGRYIILRVTYGLHHDGDPSLRYADLQNYFAGKKTPALSDVRDAVLTIRASKGMLITPGDPESQSAGSFFKNPVLTTVQFDELARRARERNLQVPSYPALMQQKKISAAWLVENSGFAKGYVKGRAGISSKHALALVNCGGASASDILALKDEIQQRVEQLWGIKLEPEPVLVGF
ncbi:MAG: UDP-N-acetylmuramate dehydrogenase [Acidobacteria bacterium]|nr:MAG: UDP-N-acetylmuramate dehydrogenase [Acidobacteriota bacterium]